MVRPLLLHRSRVMQLVLSRFAGFRFTARPNARTLALCGVILVDDGSAAATDEKARPC
jgi:hypothetical protein